MQRSAQERILDTLLLAAILCLALPALLAWDALRSESASPGSRLWPLTIAPSLSSSFAEYRDGHLHAGLDIRTGGREGVPCRAVEDGAVVRMRASPWGYGKALYLKLATGETAVYAHLSQFAPALEDYLYQGQRRLGRYEVDLQVPARMFHVRRGDIIAYTGSTGAGAPHLHFEVRDIRGDPVNPLSRGWKIEDSLPPAVSKIMWIPLSVDARIDGRCSPAIVDVVRSEKGAYMAQRSVSIEGCVGLAASVADRSGPVSGNLAPYRLTLSVDSLRLADIVLERFKYSQTNEVQIQFEMESARESGEHYILLFGADSETLPGRSFVHDGVIDETLAASEKAVLTVSDRNGNACRVEIPFGPKRSVASLTAAHAPTLFCFRDILALGREAILYHPPSLERLLAAIDSDGGQMVLSAKEIMGRTLHLVMAIGGRHVAFAGVASSKGGTIILDQAGAELSIGPGALFFDSVVSLEQRALQGEEERWNMEPIPVTDPVEIGPPSLALKSPASLSLYASGAKEKIAVYRMNSRKERWEYVSSSVKGDSVRAAVSEPGVYRVMRDTVPPEIGEPKVVRHEMLGNGRVFPEIVTPLLDEGSGIDYLRSEVLLDGEKRVWRWDPFRKKMFVLLRDENIMGGHDLSVEAWDRSGNLSRIHAMIDIPPFEADGSTGGKHDAQ